jgi:S1-C subfamily serine protease
MVGAYYSQGTGVTKDLQQAYFWFLIASARGHKGALEGREVMERQLTPQQISEAQTAARTWAPSTSAKSNTPSGSGSDSRGDSPPSQGTGSQPDGTGSGFRVARNSIVTNHHVIDGCTRLSVNGVPATVQSSDARSDLALLHSLQPGQSANLRARRLAVGDSVAVAGYPLRGLLSGFNMTTGTVSSMSGMGGDTRLVQITAPVQPGNSGGPMLDSAGQVMGVLVSKLDAIKTAKLTGDIPQNVNFAINVNVLRSFLDSNDTKYETTNVDKTVTTTVIAEKAKTFTVLIECWK